jgi:POT family proton-dependent oligopeptide transporter
MEQPQQSGHPAKGISILSVSYLLERFSYYGLRSILILYMVNRIGFEKGEATKWYGTFTGAIAVSVFIGALLGDFLIGAPAAIIIGGILEAIGCFCIAIPGKETVFLGLSLVVIGSGLLKPNMLAQVTSIYKSRVRYMDAGFSIFYFAINLGAFLAPLIIGITDDGNPAHFSIGICMAGIVALVAIVPVVLDYKNLKSDFTISRQYKVHNSTSSILALICILLLQPVFWAIYGTVGNFAFEANGGNHFYGITLPMICLLILSGPVSAIIWSFVKMESIYKISLGFLFLVIPLLIILLFQSLIKHNTILIGISETLIAIPAYSVIARFVPPKLTALFFATAMGLSFFANRLTGNLQIAMSENHNATALLLIGLSVFAAIIFFVLALTLPKAQKINSAM